MRGVQRMTAGQALSGRRALIMGLAADAAEPIALALAEAGADVALTTATNDAEEAFALRRISRGVRNHGRNSMNESVDMAIGTGVPIAMRQVAKELGGLDIVVVGPSVSTDKAPERLTDADWARLVNTNLGGVFYACRSAHRELRGNEPPGGHIVVVIADEDAATDAVSAATRAGVRALAIELASAWAGDGITVNAVLAGDDAAPAVLRVVGAQG